MQEDKEGAFDTAHTLMQCLSVMAGMISTWTVNEDAMARASAAWGTLPPPMLPITWPSVACRSARHMLWWAILVLMCRSAAAILRTCRLRCSRWKPAL
ncbi:MAG: hypothetical protein ACLU0O_05220 [Collinsella sp.]